MRINRKTRPIRVLGLALAGLGVSGLGVAFAAQLGIDSQQVVAGVAVVADCDVDGVTVSLVPDYAPGGPSAGYHVTEVEVADLNDVGSVCEGSISVVLTDDAGNALATGSIGYPAAPTDQVTITLSSPVSISAITGVAVAIG